MPVVSGGMLQTVREAVWTAITNGSGTGTTVFKQYKHDTDPNKNPEQIPSGYSDIPAVSVLPSKVDNKWVTQRYNDYDYFLDVLVYDKTLPAIEGSWELMWKAVIRTAPAESPTVPYTRGACGKPAELVGTTFDKKRIGKEEKYVVWTARMTFGFRLQAMPKLT